MSKDLTYKNLVWKVKGFMFQKDDFRLDEDSFDNKEEAENCCKEGSGDEK